MTFDDRDVHDDWNISEARTEEVRSRARWEERIIGALVGYWIYQHLGNLSPAELEQDSLYQQVRAADDGEPLLREFALKRTVRQVGVFGASRDASSIAVCSFLTVVRGGCSATRSARCSTKKSGAGRRRS